MQIARGGIWHSEGELIVELNVRPLPFPYTAVLVGIALRAVKSAACTEQGFLRAEEQEP